MIIEFGSKLKKVRNSYGLKQIEFANKLGINSSQYSKIERGVLLPTLLQVLEVIKIFKISACWIMENNGDMFQTDQRFGKWSNAPQAPIKIFVTIKVEDS